MSLELTWSSSGALQIAKCNGNKVATGGGTLGLSQLTNAMAPKWPSEGALFELGAPLSFIRSSPSWQMQWLNVAIGGGTVFQRGAHLELIWISSRWQMQWLQRD